MQSEEVSKERCCLRYCLVEQRTVCIVNVWGYTEILPFTFILWTINNPFISALSAREINQDG